MGAKGHTEHKNRKEGRYQGKKQKWRKKDNRNTLVENVKMEPNTSLYDDKNLADFQWAQNLLFFMNTRKFHCHRAY